MDYNKLHEEWKKYMKEMEDAFYRWVEAAKKNFH